MLECGLARMAVPALGPVLAGVNAVLLIRPLWYPVHWFCAFVILGLVSKKVSCSRIMSALLFFKKKKVLAGFVIPLTFQEAILIICVDYCFC